ncbi:hypothetical protein Z042_14330 [Chania multitudinisentens RB-25]|uniref:Uncharacterized protein n=1 Tax=Chania multitudinisentens RB-25 TaxID=1441930 RepID=W0LLC3_9GAMM|nr:hypothetical protein [Chania multitudinisentens]AHG22815.2 hypothetical protein Z042_14330 [Chania multitudinisentens RB-25]
MNRHHTFTHYQTASHEAWRELCRATTRVHHQVRNASDFRWLGKPLVVCDHSGNQPLRYDDSLIGIGVIAFNGDFNAGLSGDPFCLVRSFVLERQQVQCDTGHHPYDFLVMAVLLLASHFCSGCYGIRSTVACAEWQQVADWLNTHLDLAVTLPSVLKTN